MEVNQHARYGGISVKQHQVLDATLRAEELMGAPPTSVQLATMLDITADSIRHIQMRLRRAGLLDADNRVTKRGRAYHRAHPDARRAAEQEKADDDA